ncbi:MAG: hypothetical protein ACI83B_003060 [Sediminicola sp.]|jgi:hypothetical protein
MKRLFTLLALFAFLNLNAQWNTDTAVNTLVVDSEGGDMKAIGTSDGKTYVVFWKVVSAPTNYELRLQVLDVDGSQMLGNDGILVSSTLPMSTFTVIWNIGIDANDNLYIGATGTGGGEPAYVFKLDSSGNHLWGTSGVNVGSGYSVTILPLSTGAAIVSWFPSGEAVMQKFDSSGVAVWGSSQPVLNAGNDTVPANMFELSNGDYILVFHSLTFGINSILYAQRYNSDGMPQWANPTQLSNNGTVFNTSYSGLQDGDVVYMGYKASPGSRFDSFLQRIDGDGSLPWGINGTDFDLNQTDYEMNTQIAYESGSDYIWAICTYTNPSQGQKGEYVQKFDKTSGERQLTDNAKQVYAIGSEKIHVGGLQLKNDSPLFLLKSGLDNGSNPTTLGVVYLTDTGDFAWMEESREVATFSANKSRIHYTKPVNNQSVAVFIEEKSGPPKIYAQNFIDEVLASEEFEGFRLFYNNPISNELRINSAVEIEAVAIFSVLGQRVYNKTYNTNSNISINTEEWSSGLYVVVITLNDGVQKEIKLIKN